MRISSPTNHHVQLPRAEAGLAACPHMARLQATGGCPVDGGATDPHLFQEDHPIPRDLAPCHTWLGHDKIHQSAPSVSPDAWKNAKRFDVVVVGAGMSGLHTAWRLKGLDGSAPADPTTEAPSVVVFERTHHVGGRARSTKIEGASIPIDLGAMRFSTKLHPLTAGLAEHFNLQTREFPVNGDNNLQYFRGKRLTNKQVAEDPSILPFNVAPNERGKSSDELLAMAIEAVVPNFRNLTTEQWDESKRNITVPVHDPSTGKSSQVPLHQLGLQNILTRTLSKEAVALVTNSLGYHRYEMNWDAGQAMQMLSENFVPDVVYETPLDGMKAFPKALAADLRKSGTDINTKQTLRTVDYDADKKEFRLIFENMKGEPTPIVSRQLVLAMPKAPLEELVESNPFLQGTTLDKNLDKVTPIPMSRIFVAFDKPWWNDMGIQGGRSVTDLQINQVYYYGAEGDKRPYVQAYVDADKAAYFEGLQNPADPGVTTNLCVKPQLAQELHRQLAELHGRDIPAPTGFLYKCWADDFFGGATHAWKAGSKPSETSASMIAPIPGVKLYVCGEAFSTNQGWIQGALETSERVLAQMGKAPTQVLPRT